MRPDDPDLGPTAITVGCANFESVPRDKAATIEKMQQWIADAAAAAATSLVFPELALNTWGDCAECADAHEPCAWHRGQAEVADGPVVPVGAGGRGAHGVHVIYGFEEADETGSGAIHNSANVVAPDRLVGTYRKLHLGIPLETDRFTPGDALPVFATDLGPDRDPDLLRLLHGPGAQPGAGDAGRPPAREPDRPVEPAPGPRAPRAGHQRAGAREPGGRGVGQPGRHQPRTPEWAGGSVIAVPEFPGFPVTLARAGTGEELITATIDFAAIAQWYDLLPWREWRAGPQRPITDLVADALAAQPDPV